MTRLPVAVTLLLVALVLLAALGGVAFVRSGGELVLARNSHWLKPAEALALARWILDTFGRRHEALHVLWRVRL